MTQENLTIEYYLKLIAGLLSEPYPSSKVFVSSEDRTVLFSLAKQVYQKKALTDRQFNLAKHKLSNYREQFIQEGYDNFDLDIDLLEMPLRSIDRSKTISIVDDFDRFSIISSHPLAEYKQWIKIRFPFNKKTIVAVEKIAQTHKKIYFHERGTHEHYFALTENAAYDVVSTFTDRNFHIDQQLVDIAAAVEKIKQTPQETIPCIYEGKTYNVKDIVELNIKKEVGDSVVKLIDRHRRYGLMNYSTVSGNGLVSEIANRSDTNFLAKPSEYSMREVLEAVHSLDRYPLLVVLNEYSADEELFSIWETVRTYVDCQEQSVLFRQEGTTDFNQFVKDKKLNNWLDADTKIVYTSNTKLPKLLLKTDWRPITAVMFDNNRTNRYLDSYIQTNCDLVINYQEQESMMRKYSGYYTW
jgi:hypothetical protein